MTTLAKLEEAEDTRVSVYEYIKTHKDCLMPDMVKDLGITKNQAIHHLKYLVGQDYVAKMVRRNATKRFAVYNSGKRPYTRKTKVNPVHEKQPELILAPQATAVSRVIRLTDRPYLNEALPRKRTSGSQFVSIGSGMSLFRNW